MASVLNIWLPFKPTPKRVASLKKKRERERERDPLETLVTMTFEVIPGPSKAVHWYPTGQQKGSSAPDLRR